MKKITINVSEKMKKYWIISLFIGVPFSFYFVLEKQFLRAYFSEMAIFVSAMSFLCMIRTKKYYPVWTVASFLLVINCVILFFIEEGARKGPFLLFMPLFAAQLLASLHAVKFLLKYSFKIEIEFEDG